MKLKRWYQRLRNHKYVRKTNGKLWASQHEYRYIDAATYAGHSYKLHCTMNSQCRQVHQFHNITVIAFSTNYTQSLNCLQGVSPVLTGVITSRRQNMVTINHAYRIHQYGTGINFSKAQGFIHMTETRQRLGKKVFKIIKCSSCQNLAFAACYIS